MRNSPPSSLCTTINPEEAASPSPEWELTVITTVVEALALAAAEEGSYAAPGLASKLELGL